MLKDMHGLEVTAASVDADAQFCMASAALKRGAWAVRRRIDAVIE